MKFEQSSGANNWVYKFQAVSTNGAWVELPGKTRSAYRSWGDVIQLIRECRGINGKLCRTLLRQFEDTKPFTVHGVFEGELRSKAGRFCLRSIWLEDSETVVLATLDDEGLRHAMIEIRKREQKKNKSLDRPCQSRKK